jgi:hypothetical protein
MRYAVIVEEGESSFGAHVPDLRGASQLQGGANEIQSGPE